MLWITQFIAQFQARPVITWQSQHSVQVCGTVEWVLFRSNSRVAILFPFAKSISIPTEFPLIMGNGNFCSRCRPLINVWMWVETMLNNLKLCKTFSRWLSLGSSTLGYSHLLLLLRALVIMSIFYEYVATMHVYAILIQTFKSPVNLKFRASLVGRIVSGSVLNAKYV